MSAPGDSVMPVPCPHLPDIGVDSHPASRLAAYRDGERGADFYRQALHCGQSRWLEKLPAQALLMLNRAMGASLCHRRDATVLADHPIPYQAVGWILRRDDGGGFLGNPRRHYQHLATRMSGWDIERRTARAWACWVLAKHVNPAWEADHVQIAREGIVEPAFETVHAAVVAHGLPGEHLEWQAALKM
ncbi:hypothetical protein [Luteolibacter sp. LG18]|uniref:hypothetical protein n=1 Tax=Luteolibacter sp. LG18 TaxID=2819286 RepID=UPI002B2A278B|nr:hypothetical protein llg_09410 [Luteolibacter sp. LG18]